LQTTPESRLRKANPFVVDNDSIACSLGSGFRFITAKRLPSFVQHSFRFHGLIQDTHVGNSRRGGLRAISCQAEKPTEWKTAHRKPPNPGSLIVTYRVFLVFFYNSHLIPLYHEQLFLVMF